MTDKEINKKIQDMVKSVKTSNKKILTFVKKKECQAASLTPSTLGMLFEIYADVKYDAEDATTCFSRAITVEELEKIHPNFRSTNGCQWARSDASYLGKKYKIKREHKNGKVYSVKLDGTNRNSVNKYRGIRQDIRNEMLKRKCALLDVGVNVEVDHKNGRYDELTNTDIKTQKIQDFQPLCKPANDAKRQHCTVCKQCGKRFDARTMGYQVGWICGDENTKVCTGCFWYDIEKFNHEVSKGFVKTA